MRIGIDYTSGIRQPAGVGTYVRGLIHALLDIDQHNQYELIASSFVAGFPYTFPHAENVRSHCLHISDRIVNKIWYQYKFPVPATLYTGNIDMYYGPDFVLPPLPKKVHTIVTVHDLAFLEHPEYAVPKLATYLNKVVPDAVRRADRVTAVSAATRDSLITHYQTPAEKITIIPNAVGKHYRRVMDAEERSRIEVKFHIQHPFILCVGTLEPRKNHKGLIQAFQQLQKNQNAPAMLGIAGGGGWLYDETKQTVANLHLQRSVHFLGRISEEDKVGLYSVADVFVYPSFFEGFGLPVLEAMACGTPVITSNISSLAEVADNAALLIDPYSPSAIADAIRCILEDGDMRRTYIEKGYKRAEQYTWERSATLLLKMFHELEVRTVR